MAVEARRVLKRQTQDMEGQREIDLKVGEVLVRKMQADKKFGNDAQVTRSRGEAIVAFDNIIATTDVGNAKLAGVLERAYFYAIPLMLEHKANMDVVESGEDYLRLFPVGRYRTDVQNWINQARIGL